MKEGKVQRLGIRLAVAIGIIYLKIRAKRFEIIGIENLPQSEESCLIVSNHIDYGDPPLLWLVLGRGIRFWAKRDITKLGPLDLLLIWILQWLFGVIPINRNISDLSPIRKGRAAIAEGCWVGVFPEGMRNKQEIPVLQPAYVGAALLARQTGVLIVPIGIQGTRGLLNPGAVLSAIWRPWRLLESHTIIVTIGKPFNLPEKAGRRGRESVIQDAHFIQQQIAQLLPKELRGEFAQETTSARE